MPRLMDRWRGPLRWLSPRGGPTRDQRDKFDRFTAAAKQTLVLAQRAAVGCNHRAVGTEHLLLGLIQDREGIAGKALAQLGIGMEAAANLVVGQREVGCAPLTLPIGLDGPCKHAIERAVSEAREPRHNSIGTEHLLLGLVDDGACAGARVLARVCWPTWAPAPSACARRYRAADVTVARLTRWRANL